MVSVQSSAVVVGQNYRLSVEQQQGGLRWMFGRTFPAHLRFIRWRLTPSPRNEEKVVFLQVQTIPPSFSSLHDGAHAVSVAPLSWTWKADCIHTGDQDISYVLVIYPSMCVRLSIPTITHTWYFLLHVHARSRIFAGKVCRSLFCWVHWSTKHQRFVICTFD